MLDALDPEVDVLAMTSQALQYRTYEARRFIAR
jgi:hypothetical protein